MHQRKNPISRKIKLTPLLTISILVAFFLLLYGFKVYQQNKLNKGAFITYATIEKLRENVRKGRSGRIDIVYFYFVKNDTVFHKLQEIPAKSIKSYNLKLYDAYKLRVAKLDYGVFEIDFNERVDTVIKKHKYQTQIYNTFIHRNIIE